jgi:hypothetical protein
VVIDLDAPEYYSSQDVEAYALAMLQRHGAERGPDNPYAADAAARPLAVRIAELSRGNFLVAGLTAQSHADYDQEPADPRELAPFAADAEDALYQALEQTLERGGQEAAGMSVSTALTALTALAFAEAPGLSCDLWSAAVESLPGEPLTVRLSDMQLARLARSAAGSFVVETSGQDSTARHAELAGLLDELLADDEYLLDADLQRLTPLAAQARTEAGKEQARLLRLTPYAVQVGPQSRRALFSVTEALERLGDTFRGSSGPGPYRASWSTAATHLERAAQNGHTGGVAEVCTYASGGHVFLASAGEDEMVRVWDSTSGEQQQVLEGHSGAVWSVCGFSSADGRARLASAGADAMVRVWDPATGQQQRVLEGHSGAVHGVCAFTAGGRVLLASAGADETVRVWDPATGEQRKVLEGHSGAVWSVCAFVADGRTLLASCADDADVRVWDPPPDKTCRLYQSISRRT